MEKGKFFSLNGDLHREIVNFWGLKEFVAFETVCKSSTSKVTKQWTSSFGNLLLILNVNLSDLENAGSVNGQLCLQLLQWLHLHPNIALDSFSFDKIDIEPPHQFTPFMRSNLRCFLGRYKSNGFNIFSCHWLHKLTNLVELQISDTQNYDLEGIQRVIKGAPNLVRVRLTLQELTVEIFSSLLGLEKLRKLALYLSYGCSDPSINLVTFHPILQRLADIEFGLGCEDFHHTFFPTNMEREMTNLPFCPQLQNMRVELSYSSYFLNICPNIEQLCFINSDWFVENDNGPAEVRKIANIVKKMNLRSLQFMFVPIEFVTMFLHFSETLTKLHIDSYYERDWQVWEDLKENFPNLPNLTSFHCMSGEIIGDLPELVALKCPSLTDVALSAPTGFNNFGLFLHSLSDMFKMLKLRSFVIKSSDSVSILLPLLQLTGLKTLKLSEIGVKAKELDTILNNNPDLSYLAIKIHNYYSNEAVSIIMDLIGKKALHLQELDITLWKAENEREICEIFCFNLKLLKKLRRFGLECVGPVGNTLNLKFAERRRNDPMLQKFRFSASN